MRNQLGKHALANNWIWAVWLCCMLALLVSVSIKIFHDVRRAFHPNARTRATLKDKNVRRLSIVAVALL